MSKEELPCLDSGGSQLWEEVQIRESLQEKEKMLFPPLDPQEELGGFQCHGERIGLREPGLESCLSFTSV